MKFEDFTLKERNVMAEFVYSYDNDIMIKSDALDLLVIMFSKNMIDETDFEILKDRVNKNDSVLEDIIEILFTTIEESEGKKIMNEYFGHDNH